MPDGSPSTGTPSSAARAALHWAGRLKWFTSCLGCGGCFSGCGTVLLILLALVVGITVVYYLCSESLGGSAGWIEGALAAIGLTPGICAYFR